MGLDGKSEEGGTGARRELHEASLLFLKVLDERIPTALPETPGCARTRCTDNRLAVFHDSSALALVKLGILVNSEPVDALAMIIHKDFAQTTGRQVCEKLKDLIPRHNFMIPVQAAIGGKIIARETIKGFKKDVLTKIHGGGATDRKRKLLEKQKKGKAKSKQFGRVEIPQEAFIGVLKINKEK